MIHVKTTTVRELRTNFPRVERWVAEGERVQITKRRKVVAMLVPPPKPARARSGVLPNFAERVRSTFGSRKLTREQSAELRAALRGES